MLYTWDTRTFFLYIVRDPLNCKTDPLVHMYVYKNISREFIKVFFFFLKWYIPCDISHQHNTFNNDGFPAL